MRWAYFHSSLEPSRALGNSGPACRHQPCAATQEAEQLDGGGASFLRDRWERPGAESGAGYGITCVLEGGDLLEKVPRPAATSVTTHLWDQ